MESKINIQLAALNPYPTTNIVENVEKEISGKDFIAWGADNKYPNYLYSLYTTCPTLQSLINGTADFIVGNDIICRNLKFAQTINSQGDTITDLIQRIATDLCIFGGFAIQVIRNMVGEISELYWLDFTKIRTNKKNDVIFYSDEWDKSYGRVKYIAYPKFKDGDKNASSIFYYKGSKTRMVYPVPIYNSAIISCEIEKKINTFHINEINNNFLTSKIINFNNGIPDDELRNEIEKNLNDKFSAAENAGRVMIAFNESKDNETSVTNIETDNFADRYNTLAERSREQIFIAFRATPNLFGLPTKTTGFSSQEFEESLKLYTKCVVKPAQNNIINCLEKIIGQNTIEITPFTLN